jgi:hypothetical protein
VGRGGARLEQRQAAVAGDQGAAADLGGHQRERRQPGVAADRVPKAAKLTSMKNRPAPEYSSTAQ